MLPKILLALLIALCLVGVLIYMQPGHYKVERTAQIAAPPATVYRLISDFHNWDQWSPWAKLDPNMKQQFMGSPAGAGAAYAWQGNSQAGEGRMTVSEAVPDQKLVILIEFLKPIPSSSYATFVLRPQGTGTDVIWTMDGDTTFATKAIQLFYSMDKMIGPDFEKGLAQLKTAAESAPRP